MTTRSFPLCLFLLALASDAARGDVALQLPLQRTVYQTNERIDLAVLRTSPAAAESMLGLVAIGDDGSRGVFEFRVPGAPAGSTRTEHLHLDGRLLRPGRYTLEVHVDNSVAKTEIDVATHLRKSRFTLINWGKANNAEQQLPQGEDGYGYNLFYGHYGQDKNADFVRAGVDFMANCVMSGGHQMDLRMECDWSDPYVVRGGTRRVVRRAFMDRTRPNVYGVHFYDEPGLTWHKHPETGEFTPHGIPSQVVSYLASFGKAPPEYHKLDPNRPADRAAWRHWARWKLGFMDAAWQDAQHGVREVRPDYLSVTQSQYGFSAFTDGYYFNVVRSLPVTSGHGGYHDFGPGYFNPSWFLEMARARDLDKPCWYLPTWYGNTTTDHYRLEQYLSFQTGIQGMMSPPDLEPAVNPSARQGIVESNHLMARLGPIFTTMPVTRPPVAMLFSLSNNIHVQTDDRKKNYSHETEHGRNLVYTYLAGKLLHHQFLPITDEDVIDGTLADHHKAVVLTSIEHLDEPVIEALEEFAMKGGLVLRTTDTSVRVLNSVDLGVVPALPTANEMDELKKAGKEKEAARLGQMRFMLQGARPLAEAIRPHLMERGLRPPIAVDDDGGLVVTRQAHGDVEYLFVVNATHDVEGDDAMLGLTATQAFLQIPRGGPVYDALRGGVEPEFKADEKGLRGAFSFGPGQMRVFARTNRPIAGVKVATPTLRRSFADFEHPIQLRIAASVVDAEGNILSGSIPVHVQIRDPQGNLRHELYDATTDGLYARTVPLAANDPSGQWTVTVREGLAATSGSSRFAYVSAPRAASIAGLTERAVVFGNDRSNVFRFARRHQSVTIVTGSSDFNKSAAERIASSLRPWDIACDVVSAADANKPRSLSEKEAETFVGIDYAGKGQIKPGEANSPALVGYAVRGPVILLGNPEDNPLIATLARQAFLPYPPEKATFPGTGRGYVSWQRDGVGAGQESITLIAWDAAGMSEAVGSMYEAVAGIDPLTPQATPAHHTLAPGAAPKPIAELKVAWEVRLPDRIDHLAVEGDSLTALAHDGSRSSLSADGKRMTTHFLKPAEYAAELKRAAPDSPESAASVAEVQKAIGPQRRVKLVQPVGPSRAVACWGGRVELRGAGGELIAAIQLPQDVTALAAAGETLIAGLADGRVLGLSR